MNALRFNRSAAVFGTGHRENEVAHLGSPLREQRHLADGRAVADLSSVSVLSLTGPDRLTWLNTLTTQKIDTLAAGQSSETLVLSPTGHIEHWLKLYEDGETLWLLSETDPAETIAFLESMKFMMRIELTDRSSDFQCLGTIGAPPASLPAAFVFDDPWPTIGSGSASYAALDAELSQTPQQATPSPEHPGHLIDMRIAVVPVKELLNWDPAAAGVEVVGRDAFEALRIEAWRPGPADADHKALVGELDVLRSAVHLAKGCYRGQEAVARVHNLGQPPRRLVFLHLDGSAHTLPEPGSPIYAEVRGAERAVGAVTSAAVHWELGPIALALVKRSLPVDAALSVATSVTEADETGEEAEERIAANAEVIVTPTRTRQAPPRIPRNPAVDPRRLPGAR